MESRSLPCRAAGPSVMPALAAALLAAAATGCAEGSSVAGAGAAAGESSGPSGSGSGGHGGAGGSPGSGASTSGGPGTSSASSTGAGGGGEGGTGAGGDRAAGGGGATSTGADATSTGAGGDGGGPVAVDRMCPAGEFVTAIAADGALTCAPFEPQAMSAIAGGCSIYLGWRDSCGSCTTAPSKWGWARTGLCANGVGVNGTCAATSLSGTLVSLYGLNPDGDVDDNDKLYASLHCATGDVASAPGPCAPGSFVSAVAGGTPTCTPASGLALGRVRSSCHLYLGWRDNCSGCTTTPSKWGRVNDTTCANGLGAGNTCTTAVLGGETVRLFGLATGGDVDENDKIHLGLRCDDATDEAASAIGTCPAGTLVHGIDGDGTLRCASPSPVTTSTFREHCTAYLGIRDNCDGCTTAPSKWGLARGNGCANGTGVNNTCAVTSLGGQSVSLFGLNTVGNVNDDDKLYVGFSCQ